MSKSVAEIVDAIYAAERAKEEHVRETDKINKQREIAFHNIVDREVTLRNELRDALGEKLYLGGGIGRLTGRDLKQFADLVRGVVPFEDAARTKG